jgi:hypothetical protein
MHARVIALCTCVILLAITGTTSASADTLVTRDARGDVVYWESSTQTTTIRSTKIDILRILVRYENASLVIRTRFRDLTTRNTTDSARISSGHDYRLDTNPDRRGYEYEVWDARGEDLQRLRPGADQPVACSGLSWRANPETDFTTLVIPRSCFRSDERRVVRTRFDIMQIGPGRTPTEAGDGFYYADTMEDSVVTDRVRHSRTG